MAKSQRDKGKRGERLVVDALRPVFPDAARDLNDVYAKRGIDLIHTGKLAVQVKHYRNHAPISKLNEIVPGDGEIPVMVSWPTNRKDGPVVVLSLDDFTRILEDVGVAYDE